MTGVNSAKRDSAYQDPVGPAGRLLSRVRRWRHGDPASALRRETARLGRIDADRAVREQAKGALMLRYGIGSHLALALLLRWSHDANTDLDTIAHTLVHGICRGDPAGACEPAVVRWLVVRLRHGLPDDLVPQQRSPGDQ